MKSNVMVLMLGSLLWTPSLSAQRGERPIQLRPERGPSAPAPLPDVVLIARFNTIAPNATILAAALPLTFSLRNTSGGGDLTFVTPSVVWSDTGNVNFTDGHLIMQMPAGRNGPHLFDCSFGGVSQVQYKFGTGYGGSMFTVPVTDGHALFVINLPSPSYVLVKPTVPSGQVATFGQCTVRRIS